MITLTSFLSSSICLFVNDVNGLTKEEPVWTSFVPFSSFLFFFQVLTKGVSCNVSFDVNGV